MYFKGKCAQWSISGCIVAELLCAKRPYADASTKQYPQLLTLDDLAIALQLTLPLFCVASCNNMQIDSFEMTHQLLHG